MDFIALGKFSDGGNFAPLANPKPYTASRTHCTAKTPRFCERKIAAPSLETKFPHEIIPARNYPPPPPPV